MRRVGIQTFQARAPEEEEEQVEKGTLLKRNAKFLPLPDLLYCLTAVKGAFKT